MTMMIEVSPEAEAHVRAEAARLGQTVDELLGELVETRFSRPPSDSPPGEIAGEQETLAQTLAGRTGRVHSGGSSHGRNSEQEFGRLMKAKRQNGHF